MSRNSFTEFDKRNKIRAAALILAAGMLFTGCSASGGSGEHADAGGAESSGAAYETGTLVMGTGEEQGLVHLAGSSVAAVINNTVPGIHTALEPSKGSMVNASNVTEGKLDLALISGDVAYDAYYGEHSFEGDARENLRVLAACYQEVSGWAALASSELTMVNQLRGKIVSTGSKASATEQAAEDAFELFGIDGSNTELYSDSISNSVQHVKRQTADVSHAFTPVPNGSHESIAAEHGITLLSFTEEELDAIVSAEPRYFRTEIPAGTYTGQDVAVPTFGVKVLLCASEKMDEDLAYEIARAMDLNGPSYAAGHTFMAAMMDETFLCNDLPIPLHDGAKQYYLEHGFLTEEE